MAVYRDKITVKTKGFCDIHDISDRVAKIVKDSKLNQGICCVAVSGSTAALSTIEYESGLVSDIEKFLEKLIPSDVSYEHDKTWGDANGFSHLRSFLLKTSVTIPFDKGILDLGRWQQIVLIDFDNNPRVRELVVQLAGE